MRRWHRLLAPIAAAFILLIALTGLAIQVTTLADQPVKERSAPVLTGPCPAASAKPKRTALGEWGHWLKDVHSGKVIGPVGIALNIISGAALTFFAVSGFWMYLSMWLRRRRVAR